MSEEPDSNYSLDSAEIDKDEGTALTADFRSTPAVVPHALVTCQLSGGTKRTNFAAYCP